MRKRNLISLLLALVMTLPFISAFSSCDAGYDYVLNVYNWGEYISDGSEDSLNVNDLFEQWYYENTGKRVKVNYDTYDSNESLRAKLEAGSASYDVIIPSDYMIEYFIENDMLLELNFKNIPNYQTHISSEFKNLFYDPDNKYTVPYTYGMIGIVYDSNIVAEEDVGTWDLMWNEKYAKQILQFDNSRDAFGIAMYKNGFDGIDPNDPSDDLDVNTVDKQAWLNAYKALADQKPMLKRYVMDQVFNMMESGDAAIAAYYAGDCITMMEEAAEGVSLDFFYPKDDKGNVCTNIFMDAMCIPTCAKNKEIAEAYINFMLETDAVIGGEHYDIARANAEYIYYATPNQMVYDNPEYHESLGEDYWEILYPGKPFNTNTDENEQDTQEYDFVFDFSATYEKCAYANLDKETLSYISDLWLDLKLQ